jgi:hypothetical protein
MHTLNRAASEKGHNSYLQKLILNRKRPDSLFCTPEEVRALKNSSSDAVNGLAFTAANRTNRRKQYNSVKKETRSILDNYVLNTLKTFC